MWCPAVYPSADVWNAVSYTHLSFLRKLDSISNQIWNHLEYPVLVLFNHQTFVRGFIDKAYSLRSTEYMSIEMCIRDRGKARLNSYDKLLNEDVKEKEEKLEIFPLYTILLWGLWHCLTQCYEASVELRKNYLSISKRKHCLLYTSGGYSTRVPPLPIPNREVKPRHADGTA